MKIECEVHELVALQRNAEVQQLQEQLEGSRKLNASMHERVNSLMEYQDNLEDRNRELRDDNRALEARLLQNAPTGTQLSMQQVSDLFKVYLGGSNRETPLGCNKINAIKAVRQLFQCGLREAKFIVEGNLENESTQY